MKVSEVDKICLELVKGLIEGEEYSYTICYCGYTDKKYFDLKQLLKKVKEKLIKKGYWVKYYVRWGDLCISIYNKKPSLLKRIFNI